MTTPANPADLITWLRAQLDEDERVARSAAPGPWVYQDIDSVGGGRVCDPTVAIAEIRWDTDRVDPRIRRSVRAEEADGTGEHIARHDPARVLAEVDAKRRILDLHEGDHECSTIRRGVDCEGVAYEEIDNCTWVADGDCSTVELLALPYADRPGYREEWRPA